MSEWDPEGLTDEQVKRIGDAIVQLDAAFGVVWFTQPDRAYVEEWIARFIPPSWVEDAMERVVQSTDDPLAGIKDRFAHRNASVRRYRL